MRKILLYEAFKSKSISKALGYLRKSIGKEHYGQFLSELNIIRKVFDISIDKIDDQYLDYMNKRDAILIKGKTENVDNEDDIYCLKFWFSTESGYLGYTGTGNTETPYNKNDLRFQRLGSPAPTHLNKKGIISGQLIPLEDNSGKFDELKTGDKIIGYFNDNRNIDYLSIATVFKEDDIIYAIQDVADGSTPNNDDWKSFDKFSYVIYTSTYGAKDDNRDISLYIDDKSPLTIAGITVGSKDDSKLVYNLPLDRRGDFTTWGNGSMYIDNLEKADFAIILYLNDFKKESLKRPSDIKTDRDSNRLGASKYLSDDSIRQANLERYVSHIAKSLGVTSDEVNFTNLQKLPSSILCGKFSLVSLRTTSVDDILHYLITHANNLMCVYKRYQEGSEDKDNLEFFYTKFIDYFTKVKKVNKLVKYSANYEACLKVLDESKLSNRIIVRELFNTIIRIGERIQSSINKDNITSLTHISMLRYKIKSIVDISTTDEFAISGTLEDWMENLGSDSSNYATRVTNRLLSEGPDSLNEYKENLANLEEYINSIV